MPHSWKRQWKHLKDGKGLCYATNPPQIEVMEFEFYAAEVSSVVPSVRPVPRPAAVSPSRYATPRGDVFV